MKVGRNPWASTSPRLLVPVRHLRQLPSPLGVASMLGLVDRIEQQLDPHAVNEPMVSLILPDHVYLRSFTWARGAGSHRCHRRSSDEKSSPILNCNKFRHGAQYGFANVLASPLRFSFGPRHPWCPSQ